MSLESKQATYSGGDALRFSEFLKAQGNRAKYKICMVKDSHSSEPVIQKALLSVVTTLPFCI